MMLFIMAYLLNVANTFAQTTYFINPENHADMHQDGSFEHPFDTYFKIPQNSSDTYLLKRGTTLKTNKTMSVNHHNISISTYGSGDRPRIIYSGQDHAFSASGRKGVIFHGIEIEASHAVSCFNIEGEDTYGIVIQDCKLHKSQWGIRAVGNFSHMSIVDCEIFDIYFDGIFASVDNLEISGCHIYAINKSYFTDSDKSYSTGDCIQLAGTCKDFKIQNNILDHDGTGNKFCFNVSGDANSSGVFEYNTCIADSRLASSCTFVGYIGAIQIGYNSFFGGLFGIYSKAYSTTIVYNKITHLRNGIILANNVAICNKIFNNVLYDNRLNIETEVSPVHINNNIVYLTLDGDIALKLPKSKFFQSDNNIIFPQQDDFILYGDFSYSGFSNYKDASGIDTYSTIADPNFINPKYDNFYLQPTSICINAGAEVGLFHDIDKNPLSNKRPNIGCYETKLQAYPAKEAWPDRQEIEIPIGWSMISTFIETTHSDLRDVFEAVLEEIVCMKDEKGNVFLPTFDINQIGDIDPVEGYLICARSTCSVEITGKALQPENISIYLPSGYSFIGYPRISKAPILKMLMPISDKIKIVKNGRGQVYWSDYAINDIINMEPGCGYQIKMQEQGIFSFPTNK